MQKMLKKGMVVLSIIIAWFNYFGQFDCLKEVELMLRTMTTAADMCSSWLTLLIACGCFGNINMGKLCLNEAIKVDPNTIRGYALMSSMYVESHGLEAIYLPINSHFGKISGINGFGLMWCNGMLLN